MGIKHTIVMPDTQVILTNMGEQIRDARLRRGISAFVEEKEYKYFINFCLTQ